MRVNWRDLSINENKFWIKNDENPNYVLNAVLFFTQEQEIRITEINFPSDRFLRLYAKYARCIIPISVYKVAHVISETAWISEKKEGCDKVAGKIVSDVRAQATYFNKCIFFFNVNTARHRLKQRRIASLGSMA